MVSKCEHKWVPEEIVNWEYLMWECRRCQKRVQRKYDKKPITRERYMQK